MSLRFAALIRVSTEKQEKQGESLRTQKKQIEQAVAGLGGVITKEYSGQEHATVGFEREKLDRLLDDAGKKRKLFNCVIVCDPSRWSRDNVANETGLDTLQQNGIRFFVLGMEFNLFDPMHRFMLSSQASLNRLTTSLRKQKSVMSCIERAKRIGAPTGGRPPFGRIWDKETQSWSVDEKKKAMIVDVANRYLANESLPKLALEYAINHSFLHKTLTQRSGPTYSITWDIPDLNIQEEVEISIPPLLPAKTIIAIRRKAEANRTYLHGQPKYKYLLSGYVFCTECGYSMFGQSNRQTTLYYRHPRGTQCSIRPAPFVRADQLEEAVLRNLFETFGNKKGMERAIEEAFPDHEKIQACREQLAKLEDDLVSVQKSRSRILNLIGRDSITEDQAADQLEELNRRETVLTEKVEQLAAMLGHAPTPESIKETAEEVARRFKRPRVSARRWIVRRDANVWERMTWEDKRALIELVFDGLSADGKPMGVYIEQIEGQTHYRQKKWAFTLRGIAPLYERTQYVTQSVLHSLSISHYILPFSMTGETNQTEKKEELSLMEKKKEDHETER